MAFPRPFNALVIYYDRPPWCPEAVELADDIPIRQLKDYLPYYPSEADAFFARPMVRWALDPQATPWGDTCWPSTATPLPGFFKLDGQFFSDACYQIVGLEQIMTLDDPTVTDYWYVLARQICPGDVECPEVEVEGGASFALATELLLEQAYYTEVAASGATVYFHLADTVDTLEYTVETDLVDPAGWGTLIVYDGAMPAPTLDTTIITDGETDYTQDGTEGTWLALTPSLMAPAQLHFLTRPKI